MKNTEVNSELLIYKNPDGNIKIDVHLVDETVWLTQEQMAMLFGKGRSTITEHVYNIFQESELNEKEVCRNFRLTTQHGAIQGKTQERKVKHYNLDVIISVGYRVKSMQGTQFRIWATQRLRDDVLKLNGRELLTHAWKISHKNSLDKSSQEYEKYKEKQVETSREMSLKELEEDVKNLEIKHPKS